MFAGSSWTSWQNISVSVPVILTVLLGGWVPR